MVRKIRTAYISGDHAGFKLKEKIIPFLEKQGLVIVDKGPFSYNKLDDYPDFVIPMAKNVSEDKGSVGIIVAGSGQGEAIASNKIAGIKAGLYHGGSPRIVRTGREHDNINILCFGSRFVTESEAKKAIKIFLKTEFQKGRHTKRLNKIKKMTGL
ncbi:MAG: ribose 5-phosphate isomerase B [Patescibacteria group bacterium]|jgi:ribose 5-phosphate isomerase B